MRQFIFWFFKVVVYLCALGLFLLVTTGIAEMLSISAWLTAPFAFAWTLWLIFNDEAVQFLILQPKRNQSQPTQPVLDEEQQIRQEVVRALKSLGS